MRALSERLEATPGQEKVMGEVAESFQKFAGTAREEMEKARQAASKAVRGDSFDPTALREAWVRHDQLIGDFRASVMDSLTKLHEALDPRQRQTLGEMMEGGWRSFAMGGGHCGHRGRHGGWQHTQQGPGFAA